MSVANLRQCYEGLRSVVKIYRRPRSGLEGMERNPNVPGFCKQQDQTKKKRFRSGGNSLTENSESVASRFADNFQAVVFIV